jgi:hypothetical protein
MLIKTRVARPGLITNAKSDHTKGTADIPFCHRPLPSVFLRTLGLDPSRTLVSAASLAGFYGGAVALAFAAMSYTLWKHGGGTWAGALCGGRDSAPHTASAFNGGGDNGVGGVNSSARAAGEPRALGNEGVAAPARLDTAMSPRLVE